MKKKVLALFLSAALCVTLLPATGMAAEFGSGDAEIVENAADNQEMFSAEETTESMGETEQPAEDSEDISEEMVDNSSDATMEDVENAENAENSEDAFGGAEEGVSEEISSEDDPEVLLTELIPEEAGDSMEEENAEAISERAEGVRAVLEEKQADILWQISDSFAEDKEKNSMEQSEKVDFIMTLDNISLVAAGECSSTNNLHGAVLYGIGHSMEAFYYLDTGEIQCLVVPDEFNRGYQSVAELSDSLRRFMKKPERNTVSYSTVRRETLFSKENQEVLFTMSQ